MPKTYPVTQNDYSGPSKAWSWSLMLGHLGSHLGVSSETFGRRDMRQGGTSLFDGNPWVASLGLVQVLSG